MIEEVSAAAPGGPRAWDWGRSADAAMSEPSPLDVLTTSAPVGAVRAHGGSGGLLEHVCRAAGVALGLHDALGEESELTCSRGYGYETPPSSPGPIPWARSLGLYIDRFQA